MTRKTTKYSDTLAVTECRDGFWLYDKTRGMNLSMRAESKEAALLQSLQYYQKRLLIVEDNLRTLEVKTQAFINSVATIEDDDYELKRKF